MKDSISIRSIVDELEKKIRSSNRDMFLPNRTPAENGEFARLARESAKDTACESILQLLESKAVKLIASDYTTSKNGEKIRLDLSDREPFIVKAIPLSALNELRSK